MATPPTVAVPLSDAISLSLSPMIASARNTSGNGDHVAGNGAIGVGESIGSITLGEELWGAIDNDPAGRTRPASFDLSSAWLPATLKDTQIDGGVNIGLNHATASTEIYLGLAHRF